MLATRGSFASSGRLMSTAHGARGVLWASSSNGKRALMHSSCSGGSALVQRICGGGSSSNAIRVARRGCASARTDLYALLGVSRSATAQEIKKAYFQAAKRTHPDVDPSPGAATRFRALSSAYEVLKDPERRREYDASSSSSSRWARSDARQQQGGQHSNRRASRQQQHPDPDMQSARDTFMGVWSEFGFEDVDNYIALVKGDFAKSMSAFPNMGPIRAFVSEHRVCAAAVAMRVPAPLARRIPSAAFPSNYGQSRPLGADD